MIRGWFEGNDCRTTTDESHPDPPAAPRSSRDSAKVPKVEPAPSQERHRYQSRDGYHPSAGIRPPTGIKQEITANRHGQVMKKSCPYKLLECPISDLDYRVAEIMHQSATSLAKTDDRVNDIADHNAKYDAGIHEIAEGIMSRHRVYVKHVDEHCGTPPGIESSTIDAAMSNTSPGTKAIMATLKKPCVEHARLAKLEAIDTHTKNLRPLCFPLTALIRRPSKSLLWEIRRCFSLPIPNHSNR